MSNSSFLRAVLGAAAVIVTASAQANAHDVERERNRVEKAERVAAVRRRIEQLKHDARIAGVYDSSRFNMFVGHDVVTAEQKLSRYEISTQPDGWDSDFDRAVYLVEKAEKDMRFFFSAEMRRVFH